jgi:outer membrane biosynthesis protein TonB
VESRSPFRRGAIQQRKSLGTVVLLDAFHFLSVFLKARRIMFEDGGGIDLPKVSAVRSSRPLSRSAAFAMLSRFLTTEQEKQDPGAIQHSHWEDLYNVSETLVSNSADQALLRDLRLAAPKSMLSSPSFARTAHVVDEASEKEPIKAEQEKSIKKESTEHETPLTKEEEKARKKAAKLAKKMKKEAKKEKKRKREHSD